MGVIASALSLSMIMAYRRMSRRMGRALLYLILLSLMTPGILLSLGMSLWWKLLGLNVALYPTALGVHVVWAMPFGFLVMLAIFNRYDIAVEEAGRATSAHQLDPDLHPRDAADHLGWGVRCGAVRVYPVVERVRANAAVSPTTTLPLEIYGELISGNAPTEPIRARR